jgi:GNAT superfamily N-acetyltransferase
MALRRVVLPAPSPLVRPAHPQDAEALAQVLAALGHAGSAEEMRARLWASPPWRAVFVAELGLEVAGAAVVELSHPLHRPGREAALTALATASDCRHRGVGRALVAAALAWARREGCYGLVVRVGLAHDDANGFFRAVGFEETHRTFDWSL